MTLRNAFENLATEAKQDTGIAALGAAADAEATGNGSIIAILKRLRTLLAGGLPAALTGSGNLKAAIVESTATVTVDTEMPAASALADGMTNPTTPLVGAPKMLLDPNNSQWYRAFAQAPSSDGFGTTTRREHVAAYQFLYNGTSFDRTRTPNTFKTVTATATGDTAVWTPTSGKKVRLMRYQIQISGNAAQAVAGDFDIVLRDATTAIGVGLTVYVPGAGAGAKPSDGLASGWVDLGNGFLSAAANNVLNVNLSAALTAGKVRVVACGTEE